MNMDPLLQPEYWYAIAESIWAWCLREIFVVQTLINAAAVAAGVVMGWIIARPLRPKLTRIIEKHTTGHSAPARFLVALGQTLTPVMAVLLLLVARTAFEHFDLKTYLLRLVGSLLVAWVVIRLTTSIVQKAHWARLIAIAAWTVAALHILSLLDPTLALLDRLAITIGNTRLSVLLVIKSTVILIVLLRLALSASTLFKQRISLLEGLTPSVQVLLSKAVTITLITVAILVVMSSFGIDLTGFAFIGGAVGVGIGFGLQKVVSNLVSGFVLLLDRSIKPGDVIAIDDTYGEIRDMGARYVSIVTRDRAEYLVPNEDLITSRVVNWSYSTTLLRIRIGVGVSYGSDIHKVMELMIQAARSIDRVLDDPRPVCQLKNFGDSSIDMELRIWIQDPQNGVANVSSAVRVAIWDAFKANGIEIPFPQRVVHMADRPEGA